MKNWTAQTSVFPDGSAALHRRLRLPIGAHNKWWSPATDYATPNGGAYPFIVERTYALPNSSAFWDDLFRNASAWGLAVYEQDWLFNEVEGLAALTEDVYLGRKWLLDMGRGAAAHGIHIQYCLSYARHLLQSVEVPAVVQARSSRDYEPGNTAWDNWRVGETSILLWALGLAPHKDTWSSTSVQPGNPYNSSEPDPALQSLIATLSMGPVMPGDGIGYINCTLVMRSVRGDGMILKPDRPAAYPDSLYVRKAWGEAPLSDYVISTYSRHGGWVWGYTLVVTVSTGTALTPRHLLPHHPTTSDTVPPPQRYVVLTSQAGAAFHPTVHPRVVGLDEVVVEGAGLWENAGEGVWSLVLIAPMMRVGGGGGGSSGGGNVSVVLVGEVDKWVPMSAQRVREVVVDEERVTVVLLGKGGERVQFGYLWTTTDGWQWTYMQATCVVGPANSVTLTIPSRTPTTPTCFSLSPPTPS